MPPDEPDIDDPRDVFARDLLQHDSWRWLAAQVPHTEMASWENAKALALAEAGDRMLDSLERVRSSRSELEEHLDEIDQRVHLRFYNDVKSFYSAWYEVLERYMALLQAFPRAFPGAPPPGRRVTDLIRWLERVEYIRPWVVPYLRRSHTFRTVTTHSADLGAHNWMTVELDAPTTVRLFGDGKGPVLARPTQIPPGIEPARWPGDWEILQPLELFSAMAVTSAMAAIQPVVLGVYLRHRLPDEDNEQNPA